MIIIPHVYEGTAEEIAEQLLDSNLTGRLRALILKEKEGEANGVEEPGETLAERLRGRIGRFDFGDANLSEDSGKKFADLLVEKHRKEPL